MIRLTKYVWQRVHPAVSLSLVSLMIRSLKFIDRMLHHDTRVTTLVTSDSDPVAACAHA